MLLKRFLFLMLLLYGFTYAQSNSDCFDCHDDKTFTMEKGGKEISLNINPAEFDKSPHAELDCIDCHEGFNPEEEPHKKVITPVNCGNCHDDEVADLKHGKHAKELKCTSCHTNVHKQQVKSQIIQRCESCHTKETDELKKSIHFTNDKGATCSDCHGFHDVKPASMEQCLVCHGDKYNAVNKNHTGRLKAVLSFKQSIHFDAIECSDCHGGHDIVKVDAENSPVSHENVVKICSDCHNDETTEYMTSDHGKAFQAGFKGAPNCTDCHGEHGIFSISDKRSKMNRENEIKVCLKCHLDNPEVQSRTAHSAGFIKSYENSVHGRKFKEGDLNAPVCSDCHGAHNTMKASDENSPVNKFNISKTCGKCHQDIARQYNNSIHGIALKRGVEDAPTCTDCHGEHNILENKLTQSPIAPQNISQKVCGPCHGSVKLTEKYGLSSNRFKTYNDSYHGLATKFGNVEAANCASCHGVHNILPSSDKRSTINPANLAKTCGKCHKDANSNFAVGKVHVTVSAEKDGIIYWISSIYIFLILATVGVMGFHNLLDYIKKLKEKYQHRYYSVEMVHEDKVTTHYIRMDLNARIQHIALAVSFIGLVITGFMLKFPDAWWVLWIRHLAGESLFELRSILHRIFAVIMVTGSVYHLYYISFTKKGRQFIKDMLPVLKDLTDMKQILLFNIGRSKIRPRFDRFNYIEKVEYWALIWGTIIMSITGFALWFDNQSMAWFSKLFLDICQTIHYFEAWLAFLAIVVWHFYYVIFNPDIYPLNFTFLTGKVTEEEMEKEHPIELERIKDELENENEEDND